MKPSGDQKLRWFPPTWRQIGTELRFLFLLFTFNAAFRLWNAPPNWLPIAVGWLVSNAIVVSIGVYYYGVCASAAGIGLLGGSILTWDSIVSATREGHIVHYVSKDGISRSLRPNPGFQAAIRPWLDPAHPLRRALEV